MSALSMITAGLSQAWNTISMFAVVNSQWLLTTLGFGASTLAVQAAVLVGVALVTLGVIALSVYLGSKVWSKISGAQAKPKAKPPNPDSDSEDSGPDEGEAPEQTVADITAKAIIDRDNLIKQAKNIIKTRNKAIAGLDKLQPADKSLTAVVALSQAAAQATQAALDASSAIAEKAGVAAFAAMNNLKLTQTLKDSINEAAKAAAVLLKEIKEVHAVTQLYLQEAKELDVNSEQLRETTEKAKVAYEESKPLGGDDNSGNADLLEAWQTAYEAFDNDFNAIQGKLTAIENMQVAEVQAALKPEEKPKKPKGKKTPKK